MKVTPEGRRIAVYGIRRQPSHAACVRQRATALNSRESNDWGAELRGEVAYDLLVHRRFSAPSSEFLRRRPSRLHEHGPAVSNSRRASAAPLLGLATQRRGSSRRAAEEPAEVRHQSDPALVADVQPLQNRRQLRRNGAAR